MYFYNYYYCVLYINYYTLYVYRYYSWSTYVEGTVKPSLHRLTDAAGTSVSGAQEKSTHTLTYYQATGATYLPM